MDLCERFSAIRRYYDGLPLSLTPADQWESGPYDWDRPVTGISLSPIEWALWQEIRAEDAVMYPQYPAGRFFVDFANPRTRVAIECDGARWHTDAERDRRRQQEIERAGWVVYRITGRDCLTTDRVFEGDDGRAVTLPGAARQFIRMIADTHRIRVGSRGD